jgi:Ribosomal protein L7/L12 C-terminal domain
MKFINSDEYTPADGASVYRQSRFSTVLGSIVMILLFGGIPFLYIKFEFPVFFLVIILLLDLLIIPALLSTLVGACRSSNWALAIEYDCLWINLRSFSNYNFAVAKSIICLNYDEIKTVYPLIQDSSNVRISNNDTGGIEKSLVIELNHTETDELIKNVREENNRRDEKKILFGLGTSSSKIGKSHVHTNSDNQLKIIWKGFNSSINIKPRLDKLLEEISQYVSVGDAVDHLPKKNKSITDNQSTSNEENQILELIQTGDKMTAIKLAREVYGFGLKEAKEFVEQLQEGEG